MTASRYFGPEGPEKPHLERTGEIADLRGDVERAFERLDREIVGVTVAAPNVGGGGTVGTVTVQLVGVTAPTLFDLGLFTHGADFSVFSPNAALATPTTGSIVTGSGSSAITGKTDATGAFQCAVTDLVDETLDLSVEKATGGPVLVGQATVSMTFSA
jgi:hypothetical protein